MTIVEHPIPLHERVEKAELRIKKLEVAIGFLAGGIDKVCSDITGQSHRVFLEKVGDILFPEEQQK